MVRDSSEKELFSKQEADHLKENKAAVANSRSWSGLKDPRIVRVSRLFGGKDRHSKVSTIRGLRDRRVRLSVPTAIQLYDLQERLGLNQPSKVVDWLLKATQNEIDKLPPLQIPPGNFIPFPRSSSSIPPPEASQAQAQALLPSFKNSEKASGSGALPAISKSSDDQFEDLALLSRPTLWKTGTYKEIDKSSINEGNEVEHQDVVSVHHGRVYRPIHPSLSGLLHNPLSYNTSFYHYDPSVSLASHPTQEEVSHSHSHCHPPSMLSSPYMVPSLLASYAISQNEFCNKESSHFQIQSPTTSEGFPPNTLRTSPQIGNYPMTYFHSNLAPKH
ncbi:hypothetical protein J5N97_028624 [Dioscorea zingiberensis]|uniref:TCP domain-containing protein n=1 Tax=Dioscorea zingiberensis TaxID=325984 RepID=A0A9D5BYT1_9LILI|nr:hypothetical protein J5N97_028624 [Dioscorea zingiberensis]